VAKSYHVYIMAGYSRTFYIGVTSNLQKRVLEHKTKTHEDSFSAKYNINRLIYAEETEDVLAALEREKQLKRWRREKKVWLIEQQNPNWRDLSEDW
jgi:putative endonuclease